jgi:hypothetical protein
MATGCLLLALSILSEITISKLIITKLSSQINNKKTRMEEIQKTAFINENTTQILEGSNSFFTIVDSKCIGVAAFMIANVFTVMVKFSVDTSESLEFTAYLLLVTNALFFTYFPFHAFFFLNKPSRKKRNQNKETHS